MFSPEDVRKLFIQCQWPEQYFAHNQTLIKYISSKLVQQNAHPGKNSPKLRLIQNQYYRFGYD